MSMLYAIGVLAIMTIALFYTIAALIALVFGGWQVWRKAERWNERQYTRSIADSHLIETALGPVEYDLRGTGPVVLHMHGGVVAHNSWYLLEHLVDAGYTVLTPSRPGYLRTPLSSGTTPEEQADLMAALLDALRIERVAVCGLSAGGPVALQFALRHAHRTRALVLISAVTKQTGLSNEQTNSALGRLVMSPAGQNLTYLLIHWVMTRYPRLALHDLARTETTYSHKTSRRLNQQVLSDPTQRLALTRLADAMVPALPRFAGTMNDLQIQQTVPRYPLEEIARPTLIIHSRHDGDIPYENATFAATTIPNAELITVDQYGHLIWLGDPAVTEMWQQRIVQFLAACQHTTAPKEEVTA